MDVGQPTDPPWRGPAHPGECGTTLLLLANKIWPISEPVARVDRLPRFFWTVGSNRKFTAAPIEEVWPGDTEAIRPDLRL